MGRIRGYYEFDDDSLRPGQKKEGGLHQNLFDSEGNLRGSARFIPDDGAEPLVVTETVYIHAEDRSTSELQDERAELIASLVWLFIQEGSPVAIRWWQHSIRPALVSRRERFVEWRQKRREGTPPAAPGTELQSATPTPDSTTVAPKGEAQSMSLAEARARYLAAVAARAYSDEQMKRVMNANIVDSDADGLRGAISSLQQIPQEELAGLIDAMVQNPVLLTEESLAAIAGALRPSEAALLPRAHPPARKLWTEGP